MPQGRYKVVAATSKLGAEGGSRTLTVSPPHGSEPCSAAITTLPQNLVRLRGVEPPPGFPDQPLKLAWLPLHHRRTKLCHGSLRWDLNPQCFRHAVPQVPLIRNHPIKGEGMPVPPLTIWYRAGESNPYGSMPAGFKPAASAIPPRGRLPWSSTTGPQRRRSAPRRLASFAPASSHAVRHASSMAFVSRFTPIFSSRTTTHGHAA